MEQENARLILWACLAAMPALVCVVSTTARRRLGAWLSQRRTTAEWRQTRLAQLPAATAPQQVWSNRTSGWQLRISSSGDDLWCVTHIHPDDPATFEYNVTEERVRSIIDQRRLSLTDAD